MTAGSMQALLGQSALRAETQVGPPHVALGGNPALGGAMPAVPIKVNLPAGVGAAPAGHGPGLVAGAGYPAGTVPALANNPPASQARILGVALGAIGALGLTAVITLFAYGVQPPWLPARSPAEPHAAAASTAPVTAPTRVAGASSATDALITACLRDSTQTIKSTNRDQLLLDAVKAYDGGHRERAHTLLKEYTHEACDRATLELLTALDRQVTHRIQE